MIERLDQAVRDAAALHSKLALIIGASAAGRSALLAELAGRRNARVLKVGSELGRRLAACAVKQRPLAVPTLLREIACQYLEKDLLLLDNIELLFDRTLRLDPLDLLRQLARPQPVVATWPGTLREGRLVYAEMGHPEHQDYGLEGLVPFDIE